MSLFSTTSTGFLKDTYLPGYINQYENAKGTLLGLFYKSRDAVQIEGANAFLKLRIGDSLGQGTIAEGGDFPTPGDVASAQATVTCAHIAHSIQLTSEEKAYLDSGSAAAEPIISMKMDAAMEAMSRDIERQSWMDGTGQLANVASSSGSTITLDAVATVQKDRDRYIWIDDSGRMLYDVVHGTTGADEVANVGLVSFVESTNVLTMSASMTSATSAGVLVRAGDWASAGAFRSLEFKGLQAMIDDTNTYMAINRTTAANAYWRSVVDGNSGTLRSVSENLVLGFLAKMARRRTDGKQPRGSDEYMAIANFGSWTAYHNLMSPGLRYTLGETPDIGWGQPINFGGIPLYQDIHAPRNGYMVLHKPSIQYVKAKHQSNLNGDLLKFKEIGGSIFFQKNASSGGGHAAAELAYLEGFLGLMTKRPRNHGWLKDITEVGSAY